MSGFADLGLIPPLVEAVDALGYTEPTPIQAQAIPELLQGKDVLGLAATGTGKTAAFSLPMLDLLTRAEDRGGAPFGLVLVPTRELARQAGRALRGYGKGLRVRVLEVYGGASMGMQLKSLHRGVEVVVATPGRALDHLERGSLMLGQVGLLVLDEADEMLDMGFQEDIEALLDATPDERQTALFSATFPNRLKAIAKAHMRDPVRLEAPRGEQEAPPQKELVFLVRRQHKLAAIQRLLELEEPEGALLFCRTRADVDSLAQGLDDRGIRAEALHGGLTQSERDRVLQRLRSGACGVLVATDVAARGLDVDRLTHVINVELPRTPDTYVHRIGRVGRAGRTGVAITLAEPRQRRMLQNISRHVQRILPVGELPSVDDLRAFRREKLRTRVRRAASVEDLERWKGLVQDLTDELDVEDVAAAALRMLADAAGMLGEEQEIPAVREERQRQERRERKRRHDGPRPPSGRPPPSGEWTRLYVGLGSRVGLRPRDLVGAIAGETGLPGRAIGAIRITPRFSLVEVPASEAERVIAALRNTTIRGRAPFVRRDRQP